MPNNGDTSNYTSVFRLTPPDPHRKVIKRNRQVVSDAISCKFFGAHSAANVGTHAPSVPRKQMQIRLQQLEDLVNVMITQTESNCLARKDPSAAVASREEQQLADTTTISDEAESQEQNSSQGQLSREDKNRRYAGATNYAAVLECIHNLQEIVDEEPPDYLSASSQHLPQPGTHRDAQEGQQQQPDTSVDLHGPTIPLTTQEVMDRLPSRVECDKILTFYFQQLVDIEVDTIPMAIHSGQFQRAYEAFWREPNSTSPLWISTLFAVLSTAVFQQASKAAGCEGLGATEIQDAEARKRIESYSSMSYRCLVAGDHLLGKPYSVEGALLFVMHLVLQKRDTDPICWLTFGTAIRLAQRMGYHRDPSYLNRSSKMKISPFDAEMRRRTWYTLEHLDVSFSFLLGVPPIVHGDDVDTQLPSNLRDEEFSEYSKSLPPSRPATDFTPILPYIFYGRQIHILRRIVKQATAVAQPSYGDVICLDTDLRSLHDDIPPNLRYRPIRESSFADVPDIIVRRIILEIIHLKGICVLHRRYLTLQRENAVFDRSREACADASLRLLDLHAEFDEQSREGDSILSKVLSSDKATTSHNNNSYSYAAAAASSTSSSNPPNADPPAEQSEAPTSCWSAVNNKATSTTTSARKGFSMTWDFGLDTFSSGRAKKRDSDDPLDMALHGDVDWNELDSFLLDREHIGSTTVASSSPPPSDENSRQGWPYIERSGRSSRENWPYPQYDHTGESAGSNTTSFRTWARAGATLGDFGPS
ncbi:hypothetical protein J7T55_001070 [Diaporthe amygdali]|uniref:uncharacterized protein n=1 Tax=Phomopsis amygdali TaxID=1214568 RepID=UPI0022FEF01F|nr:uncharacterized protein J7T55_001070 [Diaporthe amygdali]KAJ0120214.1 hypothetical protein J7T55_001070 [Diaporthe amygdali]